MPNYFELLGMEPTYTVDMAALETAYFTMQRQCHPDRFVGKSPAERQAAMQRSVDANHAYNKLKDPLARAQYLLHLQGIEVGTDADTVKPSQALLVEIMELREELPAKDILANMVTESRKQITQYFDDKDWQAMAQETLRLGYLMKTMEEIR